MTYLVVEASSNVRESLCYVLLSFGIKGLPVSNRQAALSTLQENSEIEGAIIDIDSKEVKGIELIKELREDDNTRAIKIIIHTVQSNKDFVIQMVELGVVGYLLKPYNEEDVFPKLKNIFAKIQSHNAQRKHIRVKPDPEELLRLHFRLPAHPNLISGKILDISVGGAAVEIFNLPEAEGLLKPGIKIPQVQFTLSSRQFSPSGRVILVKGKLLALRFEDLSTGEKTSLARYVFKRISI